jgi:5-methylcytosine-specific restriction enzyme A
MPHGGAKVLVTSNPRRCPKHRNKRDRSNTTTRGYGYKWQRFRKQFLVTRPLCEWPEGWGAAAVDIHHKDGLGPQGPRGFDEANLVPLCHSHHSAISARERWAKSDNP